MDYFLTPSWHRIFSGLFVNLAAGWIGVIIFTFGFFTNAYGPATLIFNVLCATFSLWMAEKFDRLSNEL
ncbi:MAG: hypothetical protein N3A54_04155 [Patescibacteria group bacterium]|nr:hypothetical protein [Patescibacteria group bacterium]